MSLEQSINELNTNILALIAALGAAPVQPLTEQDRRDALELEARDANAAAAKKADKPKAESVKDAIESLGDKLIESPTVTEDDCKQITLQLASKKGRDAAVAVLSEFGVAKASELKADQLAEYHAAASAALAGE